MNSPMFEPMKLGPYELTHRVVMAPLTRMRAGDGNVPSELASVYYGQRASAGGLIITEATQISASGQGYPATPGIHSHEQVEGWRRVTDAVHARGGVIFLQLWHTGRSSHSSFQPDGGKPFAPSPIPISSLTVFTKDWSRVAYEVPRELERHQIADIVEDYRAAARNAIEAGFDGVELHGANGYLVEQFLHSRSNQRTDEYGGSIQNRSRFLLEVVRALIAVWGSDRVGVRLSPFGTYNDVGDDDPIGLYAHVLSQLDALEVVYAHLIEARDNSGMEIETPQAVDALRPHWGRPLLLAGGFTSETAAEAIGSGRADAIAFGRLFIANPDLPMRLQTRAPLNQPDRATFYGGGATGYTDYPALAPA